MWKEKYDKNGNRIYFETLKNKYWEEYDKNNNLTHNKCSNGNEFWQEYDENNNLIYYKDNILNFEFEYKYDKYGKQTKYKIKTIYTKFTRFEIIEI